MSDNAELHGKILGFFMAEWARKDNRQLTSVELFYSPGQGFKDEKIRDWVRADEPELFSEFANVETLVKQIIDIAEGEVDAKPAGKHRFFVRTLQFMGGRATHSFAMSPSYRGVDDLSLTTNGVGGGGGGGGGGGREQQVIANHASQLMRINAQMFEGTIRVLGQQNMNLHEQVATLTAESATLRHELEEARSLKMDREFNIAMAAEKNARTSEGFKKVLQLGSVLIAKMGSGGEPLGEGVPAPLVGLIGDFYESLRENQMGAIMQVLDMPQKIMFYEIVKLVKPPETPSPQGGGGPSGNSSPGSAL